MAPHWRPRRPWWSGRRFPAALLRVVIGAPLFYMSVLLCVGAEAVNDLAGWIEGEA